MISSTKTLTYVSGFIFLSMNDFTIIDHLEDLDLESKYLVHKAKDATAHAYAPYSKFLVGAAVLLEDGTVVTGTNQENAAYPSGMCAERVALYAAIAHHPEAKIKKLAVIAKRKTSKDLLPATSCGPCRQVMVEFEQRQHKNFEVVMMNQQHKWVKAASAISLLPFCFTPESLEHH
jgi:cytidine deaminase